MAFAKAALGTAAFFGAPTMVASSGPPISSAISRAISLEIIFRVPTMDARTSRVNVFACRTASSERFSNLVFTAASAICVAIVLLMFLSSLNFLYDTGFA